MNRITTNIILHKCLFCCFICATLIITLSQSHKLSFLCYYLLVQAYQCSFGCFNYKIIRRTLLNHFISEVVHDLFFFDVKFWQMDHVFAKFAWAIFWLICFYVCAETTTIVLLALIFYKIMFSLPGFAHNLSFGRVLSHFGHFYCACAKMAIKLLPV